MAVNRYHRTRDHVRHGQFQVRARARARPPPSPHERRDVRVLEPGEGRGRNVTWRATTAAAVGRRTARGVRRRPVHDDGRHKTRYGQVRLVRRGVSEIASLQVSIL